MTGSTSDSKQKPPRTGGTPSEQGHSYPEEAALAALIDQVETARLGNPDACLDNPLVLEAEQVCKALNVDPACGLEEDEVACGWSDSAPMSWPAPLRCPPGASSSSSSRICWPTSSWLPQLYPWWLGWWSGPTPRPVGVDPSLSIPL